MTCGQSVLLSVLLVGSLACALGQEYYYVPAAHAPTAQYYAPHGYGGHGYGGYGGYGGNLIPLGTTGTIKPSPSPKPKKSPKPKDLSKITGGIGSGEYLKSVFPGVAPAIDRAFTAGTAILDNEDAQAAGQKAIDAAFSSIFG